MALTKVTGDFIKAGSITQGHLHSSHGITTSHIAEGDKLFFTNARVDSRVGSLSTSNLSEGTNLYYTNARARAAISGTGSLSYNSTTGVMSFTMPAQNTSNITEGSNLYYTDARADARVALIVDSAPGTLNTLNELAAALGDDANFSTTVTNSIATKLPLAGGALTGTLTCNNAASDKKIAFRRTGGNSFSIEHDSAFIYFYNETTSNVVFKMANNNNTTFTGDIVAPGIYVGAANTSYDFYNNGTSYFNGTSTFDDNILIPSASHDLHIGNNLSTTGKVRFGLSSWNNSLGLESYYMVLRTNRNEGVKFIDSDGYTYAQFNASNNSSGAYNTILAGSLDLNSGAVWDATTQGAGKGSLHIDPNSGTDHAGGAITFGASDAGGGQTAQGGIYVRSDGTYGTRMYLSTTDSYATGSKTTIRLEAAGGLYVDRGNFYAPIFYDSNNTARYIDPASTSSINGLSVNGQLSMLGNNIIVFGPNTGWSKELAIGGNANNSSSTRGSIGVTNGNLHIDAADGGYATYLNFYDGTGGIAFGSGATTAVAWMGPDGDLWKGSSDNSGSKYWHAGNDGSGSGLDADLLDGQHASAFQAAGSYAPAGGSYGTDWYANNLYHDDWVRNHTNNNGHYWSSTGWHLYPRNNEFFYIRSGLTTSTGLAMVCGNETVRGYVYADSGSNIGLLNNAGQWSLQCDNSKNVTAHGSSRAPVFYDSNDTSFYLNPAVQSRLGSLKLDGIISGSASGCAEYGRNHAYHTSELKGYGAEFMIGAQHTEININYRTCNNGASGHTPTTWKWRAGTSSNWSNHYMGLIQSSSSMRAPVFYDSNDTNHYLDPHDTSVVNILKFSGSSNNGRFDADEWGVRFKTDSGYILFGPANSGHAHIYTDRSNFYFNQQIQLNGGSLINTNDIRAKIFYDVDDTGYYVNPASTSNLNGLTVAGTITGTIATSNKVAITGYQTNGFSFYQTSGSFAGNSGWSNYFIGNHGDGSNYYNATIIFPFWGPPKYSRLENNSQTAVYSFLTTEVDHTTPRYLQSNASLRAPIFYDSGNTGYYTNPDGESKIVKLWINNGGGSGVAWSTGLNMGDGSNYWNMIQDGGIARQRNFGTGGYDWYSSGGSQLMDLSNTGTLFAAADMRTPVFYDSNDTSYYVNPAGLSDFYSIKTTSSVDIAPRWDTSFYVAQSQHYYGHTSTQTMYLGEANHINIRNIADIHGQARAPIYYDRNNTAYYMHPDSTSVIVGLTMAGALQTAGSITAGSSGTANIYMGGVSGNYFRFHTNNSHTYFDANVGDIHWRQGSSTRFTFYMTSANMTINGSLTQNSDERVKENIVEIPNAIDKVKAMKGVYYNRTDFNTGVTKIGVLAQEVEAVLPELIVEAPDSGLKSVAYGELTAVLINAVKEQQTVIDDLKSRLETLENQ